VEWRTESGESPEGVTRACIAVVEEEILGLFGCNPFLLVDEEMLATLLCRPPHLVKAAVGLLEREGKLKRSHQNTLVGTASLEVEAKS